MNIRLSSKLTSIYVDLRGRLANPNGYLNFNFNFLWNLCDKKNIFNLPIYKTISRGKKLEINHSYT